LFFDVFFFFLVLQKVNCCAGENCNAIQKAVIKIVSASPDMLFLKKQNAIESVCVTHEKVSVPLLCNS